MKRIMEKIKAWNRKIRPGDVVGVIDNETRKVEVGRIVKYTPDEIVLRQTRTKSFDAKKVKMIPQKEWSGRIDNH